MPTDLTLPAAHALAAPLDFTVLIPVMNEDENVAPLLDEIDIALKNRSAYEILFVDDGSTDRTVEVIREAMRALPQIRLIRHGSRAGKSEALRTGARAAKGRLLITIDGDLQNDPADIPRLLQAFQNAEAQPHLPPVGLLAGQRVKRQDPFPRGFVSKIANNVRSSLLNDDTRDTACGFKIIRRDIFLELPFFSGLHRFLPALVGREGFRVIHEPVSHRPRTAGVAKYNTWNRLWVGIGDLAAIYWMIKRFNLPTSADEDELSTDMPSDSLSEMDKQA